LSLGGADLPLSSKIVFVANENDLNFIVCVLAHFQKPPFQVLKRLSFRNVVDEQHANGLSVVGIGDGSVPFLSRSVPYLSANVDSSFYLHLLGGKLHPNRERRLVFELVFGVAEQQLRFADARVPNKHYLKHKVVGRILLSELLLSHVY